MDDEQHFSAEVEKPPFLYHASSNRSVEIFEPRAESFRDADEGSVVFATPDKAYASMFIVPVDDSWTQIATLDNINCIVISDKNRFQQLDKGGAIYSLPTTTFETDPKKSKTGHEWTSTKTLSPREKTVYESGLEAMIENGVQVYFVDESTFKQIQTAVDCGVSILRTLKSENQLRGKNVVEFKDEK